jgi:hypothetical protein
VSFFQFEKPCLIVETDKPDNPDVKRAFSGGFVEQHGGLHRTKYVDTILAQLSQVAPRGLILIRLAARPLIFLNECSYNRKYVEKAT